MSGNIRLRGKFYHYDLMIDGKRYKGSTRTGDKKLAKHLADTIKADLLRKKHDLPTTVDYIFQNIWEQFLKAQSTTYLTKKRKITASKHFLPVFGNKNIRNITKDQIENYQLKRKLDILSLQKNQNKREQEISFRTVNIELEVLRNFFNY